MGGMEVPKGEAFDVVFGRDGEVSAVGDWRPEDGHADGVGGGVGGIEWEGVVSRVRGMREKECDADASDAERATRWMNERLRELGCPALEGSVGMDVVATVHALLERVGEERGKRAGASEEVTRLRSDVALSQAQRARAEQECAEREHELRSVRGQAAQAEAAHKEVQRRLAAEAAEAKKAWAQIAGRDAQYVHENRKREKEHARLKDKLASVLSIKKDALAKPGIKVRGKVPGAGDAPSSSGQHVEGKEGLQLEHMEHMHGELKAENAEMRRCLANLQNEMVDILNGKRTQAEMMLGGEEALQRANGGRPVVTPVRAGRGGTALADDHR